MKITLLVVGKTQTKYLNEAIQEYEKRLKHYLSFEVIVIPDIKNNKNQNQIQQKEKEGEEILKYIDKNDHIILLDEKGTEFTSLKFAEFLEKKMLESNKKIVFIVGGPFGFSEKVYKISKEKLSLSKMTFSHQMIRLLFIEQVYRAMTIIKGQPYHHE
ncbi:MAG: 23S rRNA (pseudouridine(1915)-N(3))-methyltransferase RlmH [Candidatus Azobacteroides sp.]|nr:23S rRNA (pseudouridine(1915)-N(3))-methyltransferase RlmH [Candidatus Azobacteroides sp.]